MRKNKGRFGVAGVYSCLQCAREFTATKEIGPRGGVRTVRPRCKDGHQVEFFNSRKELNRYRELETLQNAGVVSGLEPHPEFDLIVNGVKIGVHKADSARFENGRRIVEDVKGRGGKNKMPDRDGDLRRKIVAAVYNVDVEIYR